jgi:hypothetical protein
VAADAILTESLGLLHEELTKSATREEASEVMRGNHELYLCANRACEVGMEHATRAPYESFVFALEEFTRTWKQKLPVPAPRTDPSRNRH